MGEYELLEKLEILEEIYHIFSTDVSHEDWARESIAAQGIVSFYLKSFSRWKSW